MAYLRFSRDRRGYEQFALVQQPSNRRGSKSRPRLLYWFRSPPNIKVGREPFDPDVRRTLEARHPDIAFDWPAIISTPIPPVETENWRERRRADARPDSRRMCRAGETLLFQSQMRCHPEPETLHVRPGGSSLRLPPAAQESVLADEPTFKGAAGSLRRTCRVRPELFNARPPTPSGVAEGAGGQRDQVAAAVRGRAADPWT
jgi:hypothetical protein